MKIGLVRHFKVDCPHKVMMTSKEFREWSEKYEHVRDSLGHLLLQ